MKLIGRSKISKINPKPTIVYPMVRLPQECADVIGNTATIYETEYDGRKAFLITIGQNEDTAASVMKPELQNSLEKRLSDVESKINDLYSRLTGKESQKSCEIEIGDAAKGIRTPVVGVKGRHDWPLHYSSMHDVAIQLRCREIKKLCRGSRADSMTACHSPGCVRAVVHLTRIRRGGGAFAS
jgi:uncharacterized ParB-like nuclease family protein